MVKKNNNECCGNCRYYKFSTTYCHLMDDLVDPVECCGLFDMGVEIE